MRKKSTVFKTAVMGVAAVVTSLTVGMSAACTTKNNQNGNEEETPNTKVDEQIIKNGNFEYYSDNKGLYPISTPDSWSSSTSSSNSMSGIINTSKDRWDYITDPSLPQTLEDNADLSSSDSDKKDYNGALTDDLPYRNPHEATASDATDEQKKDYINNPFTHEYSYNADGEVINSKGEKVTTYAGDDGKLYLDAELKTPLETSVLMIHNYRGLTDYKGTYGSFSSSTTITLEANTACEISLWVKTDELTFDGTKRERTEVEFERGAYISLNTSVGGNNVDSFTLKNINTKKLNPKPDGENAEWKNNGWVQYTMYIEASTFAETTVSLTLGLGESDVYTVEGYAFFDDVTFTKYRNGTAMRDDEFNSNIGGESDNISHPLAPNAKTEFRADEVVYKTNEGDTVVDKKVPTNFEDRQFFVDFTSTTNDNENIILDNTINGGLTVEETNTGNYVCATPAADNKFTNNLTLLSNGADKAYIPAKLNKIPLTNDLLTTTQISSQESWTFNQGGDYADLLTDALKSAANLPGADGSTTALVMLSARGAAYEAQITNTEFKLNKDECMLLSFWIKTADMDGSTAATIKVTDVDDADNSSSFNIDSTTQATVSITENGVKYEDVYNGWVRCFVRVTNNTEENDRTFKLTVNFGNTTIKGTTDSSYKAGWLAVANASFMRMDEDVFEHTSNLSHSASLTFSEITENTSHRFDTEMGGENNIKNDLATPSNYTGVNGNSMNVRPLKPSADNTPVTEYDKTNSNPNAGLLSKDYFKNYTDKTWYNALTAITGINDNEALWDEVFGSYTVQPLLIVNTVRTINDQTGMFSYGYYGKDTSVSTDGYSAISVRVKASANAIANVYLVEGGDDSEHGVLSYPIPEYNFWYDDDGNILKGEPDADADAAQKKENIAYNLRKDGLYENGDGKLYANFRNLTKYYDIRFEHESFFDESGNKVSYDNLVQGETYYANAEKTAYAPHHLIAGGKSNNKVYEYCAGVNADASYYYVENGVANKNKTVHAVDESKAAMRYDVSELANTDYQFTIDTYKNPDWANKWITVTFYVHAGNESKNYRLELWSGARGAELGDTANGGYAANAENSYVVFDYSSYTLDESSFSERRNAYVEEIIYDYKSKLDTLENNDGNIHDYEKLADDANIARSDRYNYKANYYAFSLFDSAAFIPFNGETADANQSGYSFNYSESEEGLAYLKIEDESNMTMSAFIDYSVIDKAVDIIGEPTVPDHNDGDTDSNANRDSANVWLLAASIALVVAILVAMAAIFIRDFVKKHVRKKTAGKNSYNFNKNKRYVKKYVKANGEAPEVVEGEVDESLLTDTPAENNAETDNPAESQSSSEETPAESGNAENETPADGDTAEGANGENGDADSGESSSDDKKD